MRNPRRQESETTPPNHRTIGPFDPSIIPRNAKKNKKKTKKVIKISGGEARPLGGPRPLGPFDPSIIRRNGKKKQKKPKKEIKNSGGGTRPQGGPRPLGPFDPSNIRKNGKKKKQKNKKKQLKINKKCYSNLRGGRPSTGGPSNTRLPPTNDQSQKNKKNNQKNQKRSSKSQVGGSTTWGALDHSVPSIHRSFDNLITRRD